MSKDTRLAKKRVLIIGSSKLPIPAVKGGAVPNLIENIIKTNEFEQKLELVCLSSYDEEAEKEAQKYENTNFSWLKAPKTIEKMDNFVYKIFKKVFHMSRLLSLSYFFHIIWFTLAVAKHLKNNNYDYVVFENSIPVLHSLRLFGNKKKYKNKCFFHIHTVPRKYYLNKKIISSCNKIICISDYVKKEIIKATKIPEEKFAILYNSIDTDLFKPQNQKTIEETKIKYSIPLDKKILLFAGRLCKDKGIDQVIKAHKSLNDDYLLLVVGSNFYKTSIKSDFEKKLIDDSNEIKDKILFTGYIDYNEMPNIYNCADVVILPSMWEEPAGMTIIEAMACGRPVVTTISGGIPEYTEKNNCILLDKNSNISSDIVSSVLKISNDDKYSKELSQRAFKRAMVFNLNYYYESFLKILGV